MPVGGGVPEGSLRVALVSDAAPERNGVGSYYRDLADHLAGRVAAVELLCPEAEGLRPWLRVPLPGDRTQSLELPSPLRLRRRLRALAPHVVVAATPGPYGLLAGRFARRTGTPLVVGSHTPLEALSELYWNRLLGRLNRWYLERLNRRLIRRAEHVVAVSEPLRDAALAEGAQRASTIGTLLPKAFVETPATPPREALRRVLYVGRLAREKSIHELLEAGRALPGLELAVYGDGPERASVEAYAAACPNITYGGWCDRQGVLSALDGADLLVLPSTIEAFGTVALEALARGRTALVSSGCGILEWPAYAELLERIHPGEPLAEAIERVAALPAEVRRERAEAARRTVVERAAAAVDEWLGVLGRAAGAPGEGPRA
ncbi:glycosyltransferase [Halorhodospira neutriphila]|uniref:Uncharacterized protein n=1 Tax=Halorhodospira neutriphila TaxID=168379 RepID=A0ABS1E4N0_9GAMM|nr:glycosyltransferase [Halorhodospira neutriphila]MBK1726458.1 hypothetical protein [Halorhodospira neutriphila]